MTARKDPRLFIKVMLDFAENEKILPLSDAAFRALIEMTLWSRARESDGWLASRLALAKWSLEVLDELSTNHPTKPSLIASENGWQIHDYAEHQETKADIEARRERNRRAGQKGGLAKGKRSAKRSAKQTASNSPSEKEAEIEIDALSPNGDKAVAPSRSKPRKRITEDYMPLRGTIDKLRTDNPHLTDPQLKRLHEDFVLYWQGQGRPMADWEATWLRWMRKEAAKLRGTRDGTTGTVSTADKRAAETQALKLVPRRLEIE
ncbi:MAG: hypothetical protein K0U84_18605 [Actinomycetia bacterium]|nr:hypothetical protein [Actinomycetes bacterium]